MNIETIMQQKQLLDAQLRKALSSMEKKDAIFEIKKQIEENQKQCPHYDNKFNLTWVNDNCPYCGKHIMR